MASGGDSNAVSGGLLVVLGIVVALGAVYAFSQGGGTDKADITIRAEIPEMPKQ